jgi:hypothetical protein
MSQLLTTAKLTQTELAKILSGLVCMDDRPPLWHAGTAIITNGHMGFLINDVDQPAEWGLWDGDSWAIADKDLHWPSQGPTELMQIFSAHGNPLNFELPAIEPMKSWLNPAEIVAATCEECSGNGEVTCNYGHDHECEDCDGTGKVSQPRIEVDWLGSSTDSRLVQTSRGYFDKRYLWIVGQLAGQCELSYFAVPTNNYFLGLSFEGGSGLVVGVQKHS